MAIGVSAVLGFFLLLAVLFSIQDLSGTINTATGQPLAQIFLDTVGENGAIVLMVPIQPKICLHSLNRFNRLSSLGLCIFAGARGFANVALETDHVNHSRRVFSVTSNSRMMYAFARDGAIPKFFHHVDAKRQSPIRTGMS